MSRIITNDFDRLLEFIRQYSIKGMCQQEKILTQLKKGHRSYLSLLYLWSQIQNLHSQNLLVIYDKIIPSDSKEIPHYIEESISDFGSGFTCCTHGNYKPAFMMLRSSIENYLRFIVSPFNDTAKTTTVINHLFEIAKTTPGFSDEKHNLLSSLKQLYSELCAYTHTASLEHMTRIHAISNFPRFDESHFFKWNSLAEKTCDCILKCTLLSNMKLYTTSHYTTKEVLENILDKSFCRKLNGHDNGKHII